MANQIGSFFGAQKIGAAAGMAEHLRKFWAPHMRATISEHVSHGGAGLEPIAIEAVKILQAEKK
ncbi:formate dehydrogenase subunit delta [Methylocystis iwaonis]|nr:formate dehydrogenase subunit delta [Methylocystis iwaonis]